MDWKLELAYLQGCLWREVLELNMSEYVAEAAYEKGRCKQEPILPTDVV